MRSRRLTVEQEGYLALPSDVCDTLALQPGDLLAIRADSISFSLEIYRELLAAVWDCVAPSSRWSFVADFLSRPLTALEPGGRLWIPPEVLRLEVGEEVVLYVSGTGDFHGLQVFTHLS